MRSILSVLLNFVYMILGVADERRFPPPLSKSEETECFMRMKEGDRAARDKLIEHNLRLVSHVVRKYYAASKNQDDLLSVGTIGLIKAVDSFDCKTAHALLHTGQNASRTRFSCCFAVRKRLLVRSRSTRPSTWIRTAIP